MRAISAIERLAGGTTGQSHRSAELSHCRRSLKAYIQWRPIASGLLLSVVVGCVSPQPTALVRPDLPVGVDTPIKGTLGELIEIRGDIEIEVRGLGVVVGLGSGGHTRMNERQRAQITKEILQQLRSAQGEGASPLITAQRLLDDPDTAVVRVVGYVPAGTRRGERFDVEVEALPGTDTSNLAGGLLYTAALHRTATVGGERVRGARYAKAQGPVFQNPATETADARNKAGANLRKGRILGGGINLEDRPVLLLLQEPDARNTRLVETRINERFQGVGERPASGRRDGNVTLTIPMAFLADREHFLDLILHLPADGTPGALEKFARKVTDAMAGKIDYRQLFGRTGGGPLDLHRCCLVLEGIGRPALPYITPMFTDPRLPDEVRLAAAEVATRLGDSPAAEALGSFVFGEGLSPGTPLELRLAWQERAVRTLASAVESPRGGAVLQRIVRSHPSPKVRITAYEALRRRGDPSIQTYRLVQRSDLAGRDRTWFELDIVPNDLGNHPLLYCTRRDRPRLALFGADIALEPTTDYLSREVLDTASGLPRMRIYHRPEQPDQLCVRVAARRRNTTSPPELTCSHKLVDLITLLAGTAPDTSNEPVTGLGIDYSEIVGLLVDLTRSTDPQTPPALPVTLVLQKTEPELPELVVRPRRKSLEELEAEEDFKSRELDPSAELETREPPSRVSPTLPRPRPPRPAGPDDVPTSLNSAEPTTLVDPRRRNR